MKRRVSPMRATSEWSRALIVLVAPVLVLLAACGGAIPAGRYGVADVDVHGLDSLDDAALEACLGTRRIPVTGVDLGASSSPDCNTPPFDGRRVRVDFFSWPWVQWPLFDESVFERDQQRVLRWLRARGHYEGRITGVSVDPPEAIEANRETLDRAPCADEEHGCQVRVRIDVDEGPAVRVARVEIHGDDSISDDLRRQLRAAMGVRRGDRFDETVFDEARRAMVRVLADRSYVDATIVGQVKVNVTRHEAFVAFEVETGPPAALGRICVYGNGSVPATPVLAATYLAPGDPFSLSELEEAQRAIYALGTFASVELRHHAAPGVETTDTREEHVREETGEVEITSTTRVADPEALRDPDADTTEEGPASPEEGSASPAEGPASPEEGSAHASTTPETPSLCREPERAVPEGTRVVDLDVRLTPGRMERMGVGFGLQSGNTLMFSSAGASTSTGTLASNQWDVHLSFSYEHRNVADSMLRVRIEERPRLICPEQFPGCDLSGIQQAIPFGNLLALDVRWPAFIEPRSVLVAGVSHDYGPAPFLNFFRHELDGRIGMERSFFDGRVFLAGGVRGNLFFPDEEQVVRLRSVREETRALILEQTVYVDLRDHPRDPHEGAYFSVGLQESGLNGVSSWDYLRVVADARGYLSLPFGMVLAGRFSVGAMFVLGSYGLDPNNVYQLATLGPFSQRLTGGGPVSNRGFPAGYMGDVERREATSRPTPDGGLGTNTVVLVSGGLRRWEASLELRIPITPDLGVAVFTDAGDVSREETFRFDRPNLAFGGGLRLRTFIGTFRFDLAGRPTALQNFGAPSSIPTCDATTTVDCRPESTIFGLFPGAAHLTLGEAF